jgi:hypothetical protein
MSSPFIKTIALPLAIASATLLVQIGSAAAASPRADFQQQVRQVLAGTIAGRSVPHSEPGRADPPGHEADAQASMRRLLLGVSVAPLTAAAPELARSSGGHEDLQASVRQLLLGQRASLRTVL